MGYISCSEFDGMLLKAVDELMYENDVLDLPCPPDVADYLQPRVSSCYLCYCLVVAKNQTFISLAIAFQNNKILKHNDAPISAKNTSRDDIQSGSRN